LILIFPLKPCLEDHNALFQTGRQGFLPENRNKPVGTTTAFTMLNILLFLNICLHRPMVSGKFDKRAAYQ